MFTYKNGTIKTSVRKLVEFLLCAGDISEGEGIVADQEAMLEGSRLHRKIQKAQRASYRAEVRLVLSMEQEGYQLVLEGRADGIDRVKDSVLIDEIKCVKRDVALIKEAEPLHLAQAKCYAYMYARDQGVSDITIRITYCNLETEEIREIHYPQDYSELELWFQALMDQYRLWADLLYEKKAARNQTALNLQFPYEYREGQKTMTALCYQYLKKKENVFLQAPTGIGKTLSTLYPAVKLLGEEQADRVFYLVGKTMTGTVALDGMRLLQHKGLRACVVSVTAKDRICQSEAGVCDSSVCTFAKGHYDRVNEALYDLLTHQTIITREIITDYAGRYQVCPYYLTLSSCQWADVMICDYNYVFDPHVTGTISGQDSVSEKKIYLIDEAHNLLDRAREMYSAELTLNRFYGMRAAMKGKSAGIIRKISGCIRIMKEWREECTGEDYVILPGADRMYFPLMRLCANMEEYFSSQPGIALEKEILETYFQWKHFLLIAGGDLSGYEVYTSFREGDFSVKLLCLDPSDRIEECIGNKSAAVFFSATLLPITYFKDLLSGNGTQAYAIPSPFKEENCLRVIAKDITSRYRMRGPVMYDRILQYLCEAVSVKPGNYMVFFPSYEMLRQVYALAADHTLSVGAELICQEQGMPEDEKQHFLSLFQDDPACGQKRAVIGFCVMGSIYSEGIDLAGDRLIGVFIVGTGLPGLSGELTITKNHFDKIGGNGYDYAFRYPGINKVLQAAGRVIRTENDRGMVVLMDDRFMEEDTISLLPGEWRNCCETELTSFRDVIEQFWNR